MKKVLILLVVPLLAVSLTLADSGFADAKRFGGGRSFGSSRSFKKSYSKPAPSKQSGTSATQNMQRKSRFGGMGGMLGGLLAGTLLGSMFFGMPFAGGGFMDLLLIGLVIFLIMKFMRARKLQAQYGGRTGGMSYGGSGPQPDNTMHRGAQNTWADMASGGSQQSAPAGPSVPPGFDQDDFLEGAKAAFTRLQSSWDKRDMDDIRQFVMPAVAAEIAEQAQQDPGPSQTEILILNAQLIEAKEEGSATLATVYFDAYMREDSAAGSEQVREVWHFRKEDTVMNGMWLLDGIQQMA